jgi:hypothetical protein
MVDVGILGLAQPKAGHKFFWGVNRQRMMCKYGNKGDSRKKTAPAPGLLKTQKLALLCGHNLSTRPVHSKTAPPAAQCNTTAQPI